MNPKILIPIAIVAVVAGLVLYFINIDPEAKPDPTRSNNSGEAAGGTPMGVDDPGDDGDANGAADEGSADETTEPVDDGTPPLLAGRVIGEGEGVPGATVMLFSVRQVEQSLLRLEDLIPTGGELPQIPKLIASIKEELLRFKATGISTKTDENGEFELHGEYTGGFLVLTYAPGWLFEYGQVVSLDPATTAPLDVFVERGADISGRVINGSGAPVGGIRVLAEYRPPGMQGIGRIVRRALRYFNGEFLKGPFETRTDSDGNFSIRSLPPGTYDLLAYDSAGTESYTPNVETGSNSAVIYFGEGSRITGIVTDNYGVPVAELPVTLERIDETLALPPIASQFGDVAQLVNRYLGDPPIEVLTQSDGSFDFHPLGMGRYKLSITSPGFFPFKKQVSIDWHDALDVGVIELPRGHSIQGIVRSTKGEPLAGATVFAAKTDDSFMGMGSIMTDFMSGRIQTKTKSDGSFELGGLRKGKYAVNVTKSEYTSDSAMNVEVDAEPLEFELEEGGVLVGRVVDSAGLPIKDVRIRMDSARADTDAEGRFVLRGVGAGGGGGGGGMFMFQARMGGDPEGPKSAWLSAHTRGYWSARVSVPLDPIPAEIEDIVLEPSPTIRGVVLDPQGEPAPAALVRITPNFPEEMEAFGYFDPSLIFLGVTTTDLEGKFEFDNYHSFSDAGDNFRIIADHLSYSRGASAPFQFEEFLGGEREIEVRLVGRTSVEGVVTDGSQPVSGAIVRLAKPLRGDRQQMMIMNMLGLPKRGETVHTGPDGTYRFDKLQPGEYELSAEMVGFTDSQSESIVLGEGDALTKDFTLDPGGTIAGTVIDANGVLVDGAKVRVIRENETAEIRETQRMLGGGYKTVVTKPDGSFEFFGLPDDSYYTVIASAKGYSASERDSIRVGDTVTGLVLIPAADMIGYVVDAATGQPVDDFRVRIADENGDDGAMGWGFGRQVSDTGGRFERKGLTAGRYTVTLRASGYASDEMVVDLAPGALVEETFRLGKAGALTGLVTDRSGNPIADARVSVATAALSEQTDEEAMREFWRSSMSDETATTAADGTFKIKSFPAGVRTVKISHEDYVTVVRPNVEVPHGTELELNAELDAGLVLAGSLVSNSGEAQARFLFCRGADPDNAHITKTSVSGDSGFRFAGLVKGRYRVSVMAGRGNMQEPTIIDLDQSREDVELTVP